MLGLLVALVLLLAVLAGVLGSTSGSRWALAQVPGLQVDNFSGRLVGHWQADRLRWQQAEDRVEVQAPRMRWSPSCLLRLTLCVERLEAEQISLGFAPAQSPSDAPLKLPDLDLPLRLQLGDVRIGRLLLDGEQQLADVQLAAHWTETGLAIDSLRLQREGLALALQGRVQTWGDWPLQIGGDLALPAPEARPWDLRVSIDGELRNSLQLTVDSSGYLQGSLSGQVQPLAAELPASLRLVADGFKASDALPETLRLNQLELTAVGDMATGYRLLGRALLPGEGGTVALNLQGQADAQGAQLAGLSLSAGPEQQVNLSGALDWQEGFSAQASLDWQDFPWRRLYPDVDEPPVALRRLHAEIDYRDGDYLGHFAADLDGPSGAFSLGSPVSGDLSQVHLPDLLLQAGQGRANGNLTLGFADGIRWNTALALSELDPAYWLGELSGNLGGALRSQGSFKDQRLVLSADLDLAGQLRGQPAVLKLQAEGAGQRWTLRDLDLRLGDNRIQGQASLEQQLIGQLQLNLPRLGQLWPRLSGQMEGRLDLAGTLQAPQGQLDLQGQGLALDEQRLKALAVTARLGRDQRAQLSLKVQGLQAGDTALGDLTLGAGGDRQRQQFDLSLQGPLLSVDMGLAGQLDQGGAWRGRLERGQVLSGGQDWRLQQPASLERLASGRVTLGQQCWRAGPASLCGEAQPLFPQPSLRYRLQDFPLDSLAQWLPPDFAWQGQLNADIRLDIPEAGPSGRIELDAGRGVLRIREQQEWLDFPYDSLQIDSRLSPELIDSELRFSGAKLGDLRLQAQIDPRPANKPLTGQFSLNGLELAVARPFVPRVETLNGQLNGSGTLSGDLLAPRVEGRLTLSGGEIAGGELPMAIEALDVQALIAGDRLELSGDWRSGEQGRGELSGELSWGQALAVDLSLRGSRLPITLEPYAQLDVEPDLRLSLKDERLAISGTVEVPRGAIEIRELPPDTVKVSEDAVIVGEQTEQGGPVLAMGMDVTVVVGEERLTFQGFGLTADLAGRLHIGDNLDTRGELNLNNGRYRAYGQRLTIRRARLLFAGPIDQPFLDVEAIRRVDEVVAGLRLSGNAVQPTSEIFSEPAMSQEQALSYLVLGRPLGQGGGDDNLLGQAALALGLAGSSKITGGLATRLGIQDFQLDTNGSGASTSVVATGKLTERLSLRYGVGVFEPASTIALRYELSKRLYLEVASGLASSLDIFYKRDF
ncbi:MAG: translocation/assembly module TamB domain-containing protein [Pseudomonadota bacterium]